MRRRRSLASSPGSSGDRRDLALQAGPARVAHQALGDLTVMANALAQARRVGWPDIYERLKGWITPVMTRSAARAITARRGSPPDDVMTMAKESSRALIARIEGGDGATMATSLSNSIDDGRERHIAPSSAGTTPSPGVRVRLDGPREPSASVAAGGERDRPEPEDDKRMLSVGRRPSLPGEGVIAVRPGGSSPAPAEAGKTRPPGQPSQSPHGSDKELLRRLQDPAYLYQELQRLRDHSEELERLRDRSRDKLFEEYPGSREPAYEPDFWDKHVAPYLPRPPEKQRRPRG